MHHGREQRVGHLMPRHIEHGDTGTALTSSQPVRHRRLPLGFRSHDPGVQVVALFEVDVDDVIAAHGAGERTRATPHVDAL